MKKLLLLLLISLMLACSDSDKEKDPEIDYIDNNVIAGRWYHIIGIDSTVVIFEDNIYRDEVWHRYDKYLRDQYNYGEYKLSKDRIYTGSGSEGLPYTLEKNTLSYANDGLIIVPFTKIN